VHHVKNSNPTIDAYLLEEQSCQILSRSDLKRFDERRPSNNNNSNKMSRDMGSVPDPKNFCLLKLSI